LPTLWTSKLKEPIHQQTDLSENHASLRGELIVNGWFATMEAAQVHAPFGGEAIEAAGASPSVNTPSIGPRPLSFLPQSGLPPCDNRSPRRLWRGETFFFSRE
jgi:hypothetical protein